MIKITQIGLNYILYINDIKYVITVDNSFDNSTLYSLAFKYNQTKNELYKSKLLKIVLDFVNKKKQIDIEKYKRKQVIKKSKEFIKIDNIKIPTTFEKFIENKTVEEIESFKLFFKKLSNNKVEHIKTNFLEYYKNCNLTITKNGNIVAFRCVNNVNNINTLRIKNVFYNYLKLRKLKKSTYNYYLDEDYKLIKKENNDNKLRLKDEYKLYKNSKLVFSSDFDRNLEYELGTIIEMNLEDCDTSTATCSKGFHFTNKIGLQLDLGVTKDTLIFGIINPEDIVAIPTANYPKFRCRKWYFAGVIDDSFVDLTNTISVLDMDFEEKNEIITGTVNGLMSKKKPTSELKDNISKNIQVLTNTLIKI